ncbi:hypothetical protein [Mammaliicoccus sciuri]|nr:hypothetical protein [Mammaliicoccus sciuri]
MKLLITLLLSTIASYILVKQAYRYAQLQDTVEAPLDYFKGGEVI